MLSISQKKDALGKVKALESKTLKEEAICLVGTMVPENEFDAIQKKSKVKAAVSPNTMQNNLYSSLSQVCDDVSYVSYPAVATWPKGGVFATWPKKLMLKDRLGVNRIFMVNLPVLKQITVFFSVFLSLLTWVLQHRDKQKYIMTYADFAEYCLPAIIISRIFRFPVCLFLTELPGHAHYLAGKKRIKDRILILSEIVLLWYFSSKESVMDLKRGVFM